LLWTDKQIREQNTDNMEEDQKKRLKCRRRIIFHKSEDRINNPQEIADAFNKYFIKAAGKILTGSKIQEAIKLLHESKNDDILEMKLIATAGNERKHVIELFK